MECWESPAFDRKRDANSYTIEDLRGLKIAPPNEEIRKRIRGRWDNVAKPIDGMGRFEPLTAQIGAICGTEEIDISRKAVIIMCADNGIVEEGISQSGQEVTLAVAKNMGRGKSSVGRMAKSLGACTIPVDIGINCTETVPGVLDRKIRRGTRNFMKEPAMTREEAVRSIFTGIEMVARCRDEGYQILATGEMGIGNTTTSAAVAAALFGCEAAEVTGRGAGLSDGKLAHKREIIGKAIALYGLNGADALRILMTVGGFDIGGLAGVCIGGGIFHMPIVLDGVISMVAALLAERILPGTREYLIPSHKGKEPAVERLAKELGLTPVIDGCMALGEGTGAVMMFALLDMALSVYREGSSFGDIGMERYQRGEYA